MKKLVVAAGVIAGAATLSACQTTQSSENDQAYARIDGRQINGNANLKQEYDVAATICQGKTAEAASNMPPIYWRGLIGAMQASAVQSGNMKTLEAVQEGCMAEHGYKLVHLPPA